MKKKLAEERKKGKHVACLSLSELIVAGRQGQAGERRAKMGLQTSFFFFVIFSLSTLDKGASVPITIINCWSKL